MNQVNSGRQTIGPVSLYLLGQKKVDHRLHPKRLKLADVAVGELSKLTGSKHLAPLYRSSVSGFIPAKVTKVRLTFECDVPHGFHPGTVRRHVLHIGRATAHHKRCNRAADDCKAELAQDLISVHISPKSQIGCK